MPRATLFAFSCVKNEGDIIGETVVDALRWCEKVLLIDTGSTDNTVAVLDDLRGKYGQRVEFIQSAPGEPFNDGMRSRLYNKYYRTLGANDWWFRLDGDEFLDQDPFPFIARAQEERADFVSCYHVNFRYTDADFARWEAGQETLADRARPITSRRRYYTLNWVEPRLCRNDPRRPMTEPGQPPASWPPGLDWFKQCSELITVRHYPFRDPEQIKTRVDTRKQAAIDSGNWDWETETDSWKRYLTLASESDYYHLDHQWNLDRFDETLLPKYRIPPSRMTRIRGQVSGKVKELLKRG